MSGNGPEFIAYQIQDWMKNRGIKTHYIKPGSPWEQCYIESFHDKLRDEFLNREIFYSLPEAKILLEGWRKEYNEPRIRSYILNLKTILVGVDSKWVEFHRKVATAAQLRSTTVQALCRLL